MGREPETSGERQEGAETAASQNPPQNVPETFAQRRPNREPRFVYFIQAETTRLVKIGIAVDVRQRMAALQTGCPDDLILLGVLDHENPASLESDLHCAFRADHKRGEWFQPNPRLLDFIARNAKTLEQVQHERITEWASRNFPKERPIPIVEKVGIVDVRVDTIRMNKGAAKPRLKERVKGTPRERLAAYKAARGLA